MRARRISVRTLAVFAISGIASYCASAFGGEVVLNDGTILRGGFPIFISTVGPKVPRPDPDKSLNLAIITISESSAVQFYVSRLHSKSVSRDADLRPTELFKLPVEKRPRSKHIEQVAGQIDTTLWDAHGHRLASFKSGSKKVDVMQEIVSLTPKYTKVTAMDYFWEFSIPTSSIPPDRLNEILHQATSKENPDDRFAIARFYLDGEFYKLAQQELESIRLDFPDRAQQVDALLVNLRQYLADQALGILEERRQAGQPQFAYDTAKKFLALNIPDISPVTSQKLIQSVAKADEVRMKMEDIRQLLGQLQAALPAELAAEVSPLRLSIAEGLHPETLDRLAPFLDLAEAENRKPAEKLALALTGWILGPDQADTDLRAAIRLWQARAILMEYFRAETSAERATALAKLIEVESVGPKQIARLIPLLPPRLDTSDLVPGTPFTVSVEPRHSSDVQVTYDALLPLEYHTGRNYPMVVALHAEGMEPQAELKWWARQAQRFGYIVVAPAYMSKGQRSYDYGLDAHQAVLEATRDAKRRFMVDSDRVFLGGHGAGGDAVFDIGYSHPDLFAGILPITALCEQFSVAYYENARNLPQFIVAGELDRTAVEQNTKVIDHMMVNRFPVIYSVFTGRGHEDFHSEDARLFDWMSRQRRGKPPMEIDVHTARTTDNQFWWWKFSNFPPKFGITGWPTAQKGQPKPMILNCVAKRAKGDNVINISSGAKWHALWLFPDVVSFEKLLIVRHNNLQLYRQIPEPDITAMLEDFRLRGDRQQLAWGYLELGPTAARPATSQAQKLPATQRNQRIGVKPN